MLQRSGLQKWRVGLYSRAMVTVFAAFLILAGVLKMGWSAYWLLTGLALIHYAFIWIVSPRAGVWLDWVNLIVDVTMTIVLLQLSGRTGSPLNILVYVWMFAMVTLNVRRGNTPALFLIAVVGLFALAVGGLGGEAWGSYMGVHTLGIGLFVFTSLTLMDERRSNQLDPLTGALNRKAGLELLFEKMQRREAFDLAFVDLKNFKSVNDVYGHAVGDEVLCRMARRLASCVREQDLVIRFGGDEFLVVAPHRILSSRLRCAFAAPIATSGGPVSLAGDVGVVSWDGGTDDLETLLNQADVEMYRMKYTEIREDR